MKQLFRIESAEQGSPEWLAQRLGKITASKFDKLITKTGKPSSQMEALVNQAVAELITNEPTPEFVTDAMVRGNELEDDAFNLINFSHDLNLNKAGFCQSLAQDERELYFGFSPDGENFTAGYGCEIKCPLAHTHVQYLSDGTLPEKYKAQVQGSMALSNADRWFFVSYHPDFPELALWVERDEKYCSQLLESLYLCDEMIREKVAKIQSLMEVAA